jgi:hypothetical protein
MTVDLERKSTLRCAILFGPQSRVYVISITPRDVMWTYIHYMPRVFREANYALAAQQPSTTREVRFNSSTMPETFLKP